MKNVFKIFTVLLFIIIIPYTIHFLNYTIAENYINQGKYAEANKVYKADIHIQKHFPFNDNISSSSLYKLALNQAYNEGKNNEAKKSIFKAISLLNLKNNAEIITIAKYTLELGNIYQKEHNFKEAEKFYFKAINISKLNKKDNNLILASSYGALAELYSISIIYNSKIKTYKNIKNYNTEIKKIENYYNLAINLAKNDNSYQLMEKYFSGLGTFYYILAKDYKYTEMYDKAEPIYLKLISFKNKEYFVNYLYNLSRIYKEKKEYDKFESLLINNINTLESMTYEKGYYKNIYGYWMQKLYSDLSEIYKNKKEYKKSTYFSKKAISYK